MIGPPSAIDGSRRAAAGPPRRDRAPWRALGPPGPPASAANGTAIASSAAGAVEAFSRLQCAPRGSADHRGSSRGPRRSSSRPATGRRRAGTCPTALRPETPRLSPRRSAGRRGAGCSARCPPERRRAPHQQERHEADQSEGECRDQSTLTADARPRPARSRERPSRPALGSRTGWVGRSDAKICSLRVSSAFWIAGPASGAPNVSVLPDQPRRHGHGHPATMGATSARMRSRSPARCGSQDDDQDRESQPDRLAARQPREAEA